MLWHNHKNPVDMKSELDKIPSTRYYVVKGNANIAADTLISPSRTIKDTTGECDGITIVSNTETGYYMSSYAWNSSTRKLDATTILEGVTYSQLPIWLKIKDKDNNVIKTLVKFREE